MVCPAGRPGVAVTGELSLMALEARHELLANLRRAVLAGNTQSVTTLSTRRNPSIIESSDPRAERIEALTRLVTHYEIMAESWLERGREDLAQVFADKAAEMRRSIRAIKRSDGKWS